MRWVGFILLTFAAILVQVTVGGLLRFRALGIESVGPDLLALLAVFVALYARTGADAMLAAWALGFALDLTAAGGPAGPTAVGPMPLGYVLAAGAIFRIRGVFLRETYLAQMVMALIFCLIAHGTWVGLQTLVGYRLVTWGSVGQTVLQAMALSVYTALLMPLGHMGLNRIQRIFMAAAPARRGARR